MKRLLIVGILLISTSPLYSQGAHQNVAKLQEDARNAVGIIGADRSKSRTYCEVVDLLGRQLGQADQKKDKKQDKKKAKALSQRINQLQKKLGPEFVVLENILGDIDLKSPEGREIASIIQSLNESCPE